MPVAWRLTAPAFARGLDGEGNRVTGARWNPPGRGVVYASPNLSLCVLECFVHLPAALRLALPVMSAVRLSIPDNAPVERIGRDELPVDLARPGAAEVCRDLGAAWLDRGAALILLAPSAIVPQEENLMLNPRHPAMARVRIEGVEAFRFDARLASG